MAPRSTLAPELHAVTVCGRNHQSLTALCFFPAELGLFARRRRVRIMSTRILSCLAPSLLPAAAAATAASITSITSIGGALRPVDELTAQSSPLGQFLLAYPPHLPFFTDQPNPAATQPPQSVNCLCVFGGGGAATTFTSQASPSYPAAHSSQSSPAQPAPWGAVTVLDPPHTSPPVTMNTPTKKGERRQRSSA